MTHKARYLPVAVLLMLLGSGVLQAAVLDDPLNGSTIGTRSGGAFVAGGWQVTAEYDAIYWHVPTLSYGAFEYNIKGLPPGVNCPGSDFNSKNELSHMYDYTFNNADNSYAPGYRDDPYKQFMRKQCESPKTDTMEMVWQNGTGALEDDTPTLSWDVNTTYLFRNEWQNVGGNAVLNSYRNGALFFTQTIPGSWNPAGQSVRIAASTRRGGEGAATGSIYSNVKVYDLSATPGVPTVTIPANAETVTSQVVYVQWAGGSHTLYQVRVNTQNDPNSGTVWDSQQVSSSRSFTWTGTLSNNSTYYLFVREGTSGGMGNWSANGRTFTVNTSFSPGGINYNLVKGDSYANNSGPFLGMGFTHMRALQRCKFDRSRYQNDLAFMSSKGFRYQRALSMVSWCGLEIAPVSFTSPCGGTVPAWSDYDQQLKDAIDIAYDTYGIKTEITIFADAQWVMPPDSSSNAIRTAHMDRILADIVGREHKIVLLEVGNELWQNGVSDVNDVRAKGAYLATHTPIPVALSAPFPDVNTMYVGSAADIATIHFSRDTGTVEGGWLPVRDCYDYALLPGIPPVSSNEPIGPGSSVSTENDPIKLCMAGCFAWTASLPSYVFHSKAGVQGWTGCCPPSGTEAFFSNMAGVDSYMNILPLLPGDLASWERNDGKVTASPFTNYCMGQANKWWTEVGGATNGCDRNIATIKSGRFVTCPIGILGGGLTLQSRRPMTFKVYNPLTGAIAYDLTKNANDQFTLAQGPGAYVIIGDFTDVPIDSGVSGGTGILNVKPAGTITVDGNSSDWNLSDFVTKSRGGQGTQGDIALVGFDGGSTVYKGAYVGVLPTNAADHTAKVYSRQNATYLYFLVRVDDNQIQTPNPVGTNWANDCVEFYIDPANDGGATTMNNSTSDIQLVIDAANQKNVYVTTAGYATQVLNGVTSAVTTDASGWWLEVRIQKNVLSPAIPASGGVFGLDFNFRDNDNNNDAALTTVYTWTENSTQGFPSKIPDHWGKAHMQSPFGGTARAIPGIIQSEDFDTGGEGVAYHDAETANQGGQYRTSEGVDVETCTDTGGGYDIGYNIAGEWQEYTVNVNQTGDYAIKMRLSSASGGGGSFHLSLDGSPLTSTRILSSTGGWQNWTTIIIPGIFMSTGNNRVLRFTVDSPDIGLNVNYMDFAYAGPDVVSYDLGTSNIPDGMDHPQPGDGDTVAAQIGGHDCRRNVNSAEDFYMYFSITDIYAFQGNNAATITMDYYDTGSGSLVLQYDGVSSPYTVGPSVALTNSNTWKIAVFTVADGYFGNRQNNGSDFRIAAPIGLTFYLDTVMVYSTPAGLPLPGQASNPNPANGATQVSNTATLSWTAGSNASSHDVRFGTSNPPPFIGNQAGTTYNPGTTSINTTYFWRIDEKNATGTTTGTVWSYTTQATQPLSVTIQRGVNGTVRDSYLRKLGDPPEAAGADATNGGSLQGNGVRYYPDTITSGTKGPRHNLIWFDVSGIPAGSTINSATYGFYMTSVTGPAITGYKLSRLKTGKDWIEGVGDASTAPANAGEPTWASQKQDHNPAWDAGGAAGANDIDMATTITWDKAAATSETIMLNVTAFVNGWVNGGVPNNGMLMWGGSGVATSSSYFWLVTSEDTATPNLRPYLTINYTLPGDTTPPTVSSVVVQNTSQVDVTFSEAMGTGVTTASNYTVSGTGKGTLSNNPSSVALQSGNTYRLTWSACSGGSNEMKNGGNITITVINAKDTAGNTIAGSNSGTHSGGAIGTAPTFTCPAPQSGSANGSCQAGVADFVTGVSASDNCNGTLTKTQSPTAGTLVDLGPTNVTITVTDLAGNFTSCNTTFTVNDTTPPSILFCGSNQQDTADGNCQAPVPSMLGDVNATDNCTAPGSLTKSQSPTAGTLVGLGPHTVTITVKDAANNPSTCQKTFTVIGLDSDGDGTPDCQDGCPNDPNKIAPGVCGCGVPEGNCPTITQWRSVRSHTSLGELPIVLNASASGNGSSGPTVETRNGGIQKIEVDFNGPVTLANPANITVTGYTTVAGVMGGPTPLVPASVSMVDGDTLQILFNPGDLPDESCYTIAIGAGTISQTLLGDTDCNIRSLYCDVGGNGTVSTADMLLVKSKVSPPMNVLSGPQFDVNLSGNMNTADMLISKSRVISPNRAALCP